MVRHLPNEAATVRRLDPRAAWSVTDYLIAHAVDRLAEGNWMFATANSRNPPARPRPLTRPGEAQRGFSSTAEVAQMLATVNQRG